MNRTIQLTPRQTTGAQVVQPSPNRWRLEIPPGPKGRYHLAQLDDYHSLPRRAFPWQAPVSMRLQARASASGLPGTWGFGLWNDPFSLSIGLGGAAQRFPALPNAAWFFHASPPNYLSFRDDLPAQGFLAASFQSTPLPAPLLALISPALGLLYISFTARMLRRLIRRLVRQDSTLIDIDVTAWHAYRLDWQKSLISFYIDGTLIFETPVTPRDSLSLVLWIDNQYAALPPRGRLAYGFLPNSKPAWIEISDLVLV